MVSIKPIAVQPATVADAMIRFPKVAGIATTVSQAREQFRNDHVHALLIVERRKLIAVLVREDLTTSVPADHPARGYGRLLGRVIKPGANLESTRLAMSAHQRRRLAVIDDRGVLLGLLCLKRTGRGFCSDTDVRARADERLQLDPIGPSGGLGLAVG